MAKCIWLSDKFRSYPIYLPSTHLYIYSATTIDIIIYLAFCNRLLQSIISPISTSTPLVFGLLIGGGVGFFLLFFLWSFTLGWEMKESAGNPLHLTSLNHVSLLCRSIEESMNFYQNVLGFIPIRRPESLNFEGAWLFGHGIGVHLLCSPEPEKLPKKTAINPKDNHISFQCESMGAVEKKLEEMEIEYVRAIVEEGGIQVDQLFFHDPDGFMIEICNCDSLPVVPLVGGMARSCSRVKLHQIVQPQPQTQIQQVVYP